MKKLVATLILLQLCSVAAWARLVPNWPYEKLFAESDLVVIAEPLSTVNTPDVFDHEGNQREDYQGMNTEFQVSYVLKGDSKPDHLKVLHFRYADTVRGVADGASFVSFRLKGRSFSGLTDGKVNKDGSRTPGERVIIAWPRPDYLLFLKRRPDGRYEPVSGQYDSTLACRELSTPEPELSQLRLGHAEDE